ncbi:fused MFS/spermidine synthase [Aestuariirhabdus sp. LZHN29]|uniref:fused MFS/spermidine synthase n=1 Tax=Aestuariirhabdus sp. LZHN29 TaxID=3417462 RepID=UPI003CE84A19
MTPTDQHPRWFIGFLFFTAILCGALIMVVEVLGSRVIGPFFGVSLFIWTSLIAVTMISLALGYAVGGRLSDRYGEARYLFAIILLAGIAVLLIPILKAPVLKLCVPMGLRLGSFVSTTLLFGPSLFLLGFVSPFLVRIAAREMNSLGRTVGSLYAISTLGSVIGTALTGFVLIAWMGVDQIFQAVGLLLVLLGAGYLLAVREYRWLLPLALLPILLWLQPHRELPNVTMDNGTRAQLIASVDSHYGSVKVVDYSFGPKRIRELLIDGLVQGGVDASNHQSIYEYSYFLEFLPWAMNPQMNNALMIGMGAGIIPRWYEQQGVVTDVVDIDPVVYQMARDYFGADPVGEWYVQDARYFLAQSRKQYDLVVMDVFTGDTTPSHLLSVEALELIAKRINGQGTLAVNLAAELHNDTYMSASVIKTLRQVFDQVELYPTFAPSAQSSFGNLAVLAYNGAPRTLDLTRIRQFPVHPMAREQVQANLGRRFEFPADARAIVLTDDYNPMDFFDSDTREGVREIIINSTPWEILIYSG